MIRVGLVGYGMASRVFHAPLVAAVPGIAIMAVASGKPEAVRADLGDVAVVATPEALFSDPAIDLVVVATPTATHAPLAIGALQAGKHVVVEKPFATSLAEAREVVAVAKAQDRHLWVFHNRRWDGDYMGVKMAIEAGAIGQVVHFEATYDRYRPQVIDRWREDGSPGSGLWFDLAPHLVDQALQLFGTPQAVSAEMAALRGGSRADDWALVTLRYPDKRVVLHVSLLAIGAAPRFRIHGTTGSLIKQAIDPQEAQIVDGLRPGDARYGLDPDPLVTIAADGSRSESALPRGCQQAFYASIVDALASDGPGPNTTDDALMVQAVIDAAYRSSREGHVVVL
ncbi:oxidoreductase [Novosphingobium sp.]|uniref:oxidoreductase n=1 Tax=Novosphingobium sp. TaxID=1874826 RepID=UPI0025FF1E2F|nr:oxidoreductase [Novosphingobium sp.]